MRKQAGVIPAIVIVALVLSAIVGGLIGFKLGDGDKKKDDTASE
jgi:uncharacterized protein YcfJ